MLVKSQAMPRGRLGSVSHYIREVMAELRKAVWPTKKETRRLTVMVVIISTAVGIILGSFDYGFTRLVDVFFGG